MFDQRERRELEKRMKEQQRLPPGQSATIKFPVLRYSSTLCGLARSNILRSVLKQKVRISAARTSGISSSFVFKPVKTTLGDRFNRWKASFGKSWSTMPMNWKARVGCSCATTSKASQSM